MYRTTTGLAREIVGRAFRAVSGDLTIEQLRDLLHPCGHSPIIQRRRVLLIHSRVRMVAAAFAVLTPLWIVIDLLIFPWPLWGWLAGLRVAASAAFGAIALALRADDDIRAAWRGLVLLMLVPVVFFALSHPMMLDERIAGPALAAAAGYAYLPFVMVAGLSVFPFTAVEGAAFALPSLAMHTMAGLYGSLVFPFPSFLGALWLLALIAVVATLAAMSQLHFMMALVAHASHDALTGAFARRIGEELLRLQVMHAQRTQTPLALAFFDLDDFKLVNDRHGHDRGDAVLRAAAGAIREALRQTDLLVRWGGEEFLAVMPNTTRDGARAAVERLCVHGFGARPDGRVQTASVGVAALGADRVEDWAGLVDLADHRMYLAKQAGKNRVVVDAGPPSPGT